MCANCRSGWKSGFRYYIGKSNPWKRRGEGSPRPWFWIRLGKLDLCLQPFDRWKLTWPHHIYGMYYGYLGPLEIGWVKR